MTSASSRSGNPPGSPELHEPASEALASSGKPDWAAIRHAYVHGGTPVRDICRDHGIFSQMLYRRAGKEGWPRRRAPQPDGEARKTLKLLARLRRLAKGQIDEIEAHRAARTDMSAPGAPERDARALTMLAKLVEHIAAIEAKHQVRRDGAPGGIEGQSQADRARRRAELADKLVAMLEQDRGAALPDGDDGR